VPALGRSTKRINIDAQIIKRFGELIKQGEGVLATKRSPPNGVIASSSVDSQMSEEWGVSALSFVGRVLGKESEHYQKLSKHSDIISKHSNANKALAVLKAAEADYKGGYLFDTQRAITADVFDDFLEQAAYFLRENYFQVAAVVAGAVLEDTLRRLCTREG